MSPVENENRDRPMTRGSLGMSLSAAVAKKRSVFKSNSQQSLGFTDISPSPAPSSARRASSARRPSSVSPVGAEKRASVAKRPSIFVEDESGKRQSVAQYSKRQSLAPHAQNKKASIADASNRGSIFEDVSKRASTILDVMKRKSNLSTVVEKRQTRASKIDMGDWDAMATSPIVPPPKWTRDENGEEVTQQETASQGSSRESEDEKKSSRKSSKEKVKEKEKEKEPGNPKRATLAEAAQNDPSSPKRATLAEAAKRGSVKNDELLAKRKSRHGVDGEAEGRDSRLGMASRASSPFDVAGYDAEVEHLNALAMMWHVDIEKQSWTERITGYFDKKGYLDRQSPIQWALSACQCQPLHESRESAIDNRSVLSRRAKYLNAKRTIDKDYKRRMICLKDSERKNRIAREESQEMDVQHIRFLGLMFEPIPDFLKVMPDELLDESFEKQQARVFAQKSAKGKAKERWQLVKRGQLSMRLFGAKRPSSAEEVEKPHDGASRDSSILTNEQRTTLLTIFQRYTSRVSASSNELMARSSWFRFLHHCGILGPVPKEDAKGKRSSNWQLMRAGGRDVAAKQRASNIAPETSNNDAVILDYGRKGGVIFSHACAVFSMYAEVSPMGTHSPIGPPLLSFAAWVNAIQHILRGPNFYRTQREVIANLFGVCLKRCENLLGITRVDARRMSLHVVASQASRKSRDKGGFGSNGNLGETSERDAVSKASSPDSMISAPFEGLQAEEKKETGLVSWQSDLGEEQMCEPEVLLLLHEYEAPLRTIFKHYAFLSVPAPVTPGTLKPPTPSKERKKAQSLDWSNEMMITHSNPSSRGTNKKQVPVGFALADGGSDNEFGSSECSEDLSDSGSDDEEDNKVVKPLPMYHTQNPDEVLMDSNNFLYMIQDFGLYPAIVQVHNVKQHLDISLERRDATQLSYEAFIECLLRICFVYLSVYGNNVQQGAFSKAKCLWVITLLRSKYKTLGLGRRLSAEARGDTTHVWHRRPTNIDTMPLQDIILWPALDAVVKPKGPKPLSAGAARIVSAASALFP